MSLIVSLLYLGQLSVELRVFCTFNEPLRLGANQTPIKRLSYAKSINIFLFTRYLPVIKMKGFLKALFVCLGIIIKEAGL